MNKAMTYFSGQWRVFEDIPDEDRYTLARQGCTDTVCSQNESRMESNSNSADSFQNAKYQPGSDDKVLS